MQRLDGSLALPPALRGGWIALGNFDGFHFGHQAVVGRAVAQARAAGVPALVATFDPHPVRHFRPDTPAFHLTTLAQRERLFGQAGADGVIVHRFDRQLAETDAATFVAERLHALAGAVGVVTGEDFTFGAQRSGNAESLARLGAEHGIAAQAVAPVTMDGEPVSSSRIRRALADGDMATATRLLTRPYAIEGVVQHGDKRGRELGYPTANMSLGDYQRPRYGVYAVVGRLPGGLTRSGVANLGIRPQFNSMELLEPNFFDWNGDLYGQVIEVELHAFLRPEAKFDSLDALVAQMDRDAAEARRLLPAPPRP